MTTMSLMALIGILALVVDIGWAYFQKIGAEGRRFRFHGGNTQALYNVRTPPGVRHQCPLPGSHAVPEQYQHAPTDPISRGLSLCAAERLHGRRRQRKAECKRVRGHNSAAADRAGGHRHLLLDDGARVPGRLHLVRRGHERRRQQFARDGN